VREQAQKLGAITLPAGLDDKAAAAARRAVGDAFVAGFRAVMWSSAALAVLSALAAWLLIEGNPARESRPGGSGGNRQRR